MTAAELREVLAHRLAKPVKNPDVEVFVLQYHSRDVAVVGMVQKAGLYNITSRADSLLTMLNRAGGMTEHASSRMLFIPASPTAQYGRPAAVASLMSKADVNWTTQWRHIDMAHSCSKALQSVSAQGLGESRWPTDSIWPIRGP